MRLFEIVEEGVELPRPRGSVFFAIRGDVICGFKVCCHLGLGFRSGQEFDLGVGIGEGGRVPFLARRLVFLVGFCASTVKLFAISHVVIATVTAVGFAANLVDS